jgi:formylglycine-generating enzyme required for sulfatase activity
MTERGATSTAATDAPAVAPPEGMVCVRGGTFRMGSNGHYPEEAPVRPVAVEDFWVDSCQVTNDKFARFVADTGYVTVAERPLDPDQFPGAPPENLVQATDWPRRANF